jgi:hypothetical protein
MTIAKEEDEENNLNDQKSSICVENLVANWLVEEGFAKTFSKLPETIFTKSLHNNKNVNSLYKRSGKS